MNKKKEERKKCSISVRDAPRHIWIKWWPQSLRTCDRTRHNYAIVIFSHVRRYFTVPWKSWNGYPLSEVGKHTNTERCYHFASRTTVTNELRILQDDRLKLRSVIFKQNFNKRLNYNENMCIGEAFRPLSQMKHDMFCACSDFPPKFNHSQRAGTYTKRWCELC